MKYKTILGVEFDIDKEDLEKVSAFRWSLNIGSTRQPHVRTTTFPFKILSHLILGYDGKGMQVDHINGNTLDNRRSNLRLCTSYQNSLNRRKYSCNKSGYKGVEKSNGKFRVRIYAHGNAINGGTFATAREAAIKYNELSKEHHGVFGRLNEID